MSLIASLTVTDKIRSSVAALKTVASRQVASIETDLSVIIPAFNEQDRLPATVLETLGWCMAQNLVFEVVIVDDGSTDCTLSLARVFEECDLRVRALACPHMGKGGAVRAGMLNARGRCVLFMDADGATPLTEISKLMTLMRDHDVAIGSRAVKCAGEVKVRTSLQRRVAGRIFARIVNLLAVAGLSDTQCGFKMFRREAARAVFGRQKITGFAFDVEILLIARRLRLSIVEVPVSWAAQPGSKVSVLSDSIRMLKDLVRIRWSHRSICGLEYGTRGQGRSLSEDAEQVAAGVSSGQSE